MDALFAWIGKTDLNAAAADDGQNLGPIAQAVRWRSFGSVHLLSNYPEPDNARYLEWLKPRSKAELVLHPRTLSSPTAHREIFAAVEDTLRSVLSDQKMRPNLFFHLSPGTPAMASIWLLVGKTAYPATLIESSATHGVREVDFPFELSAEFTATRLQQADIDLITLNLGLAPKAPEFDAILHNSEAMKKVVLKARRVASRTLPVLLLGESGTGKELFARAIHQSSARKNGKFIAVNCGAIPEELVDSELFGHEKGAFTGATQPRTGHVEEAHGGTLFLDEIGELPLHAQVRLLRVLQEHEVTKVGSSRPKKVDFRLIAATHRDLSQDVLAGRFREDLFHRVAVAVLKIPALRERGRDLSLLVDHYLQQINRESKGQPGHVDKKLSAGARNLLLQHSYPGNVRELINILQRAIVWSLGATITVDDIREAILSGPVKASGDVLGRPLGEGLNLNDLIDQVARHYLERAMDETHGNKSQAAKLVGLPSYQTLTNWLKRYGVED
ncbi:MAG: sigma-54 dependent transcriptional regulator [Sumerlaeia bacterium]